MLAGARGVRLGLYCEVSFVEQTRVGVLRAPVFERLIGRAVAMAEEVRSLFTAAQLARILNVPPTDVRRWVRGGLLQPTKVEGRLAFFDFMDVVTARAVHVLTRAGVTPRRIKSSLKQLGEWLPDAHSMLTLLEAFEAGSSVRVWLRSGQAADPTGQLLMDFTEDVDRAAVKERIVALHPDVQVGLASPESAAAWFDAGVQAEEAGAHEQALDAYEQALAWGAFSAEVYFNLGNVLYAAARAVDAVSRYLRAVDLDPDYVEAWNNLGNALVDLGRNEEAIHSYRQALTLQPHYSDAHSNLSEVHAQLGQMEQAHRHWRAYLREGPAQHLGRAGPSQAPGAAEAVGSAASGSAAGAGHPPLTPCRSPRAEPPSQTELTARRRSYRA